MIEFTKILRGAKLSGQILRAKRYSLFYTIGKHCYFEKIIFRKPSSGKMGKRSVNIGNNVTIYRDTSITAWDSLPVFIGDGTFLNQRCIVSPNTYIGKNVSIGHSAHLITASHEIGTSEKRAGKAIFSPIRIGDGVWIGANSTILGGVIIGEGCIIAAGSIVNKDCEKNALYGGVPAKKIRKLIQVIAK